MNGDALADGVIENTVTLPVVNFVEDIVMVEGESGALNDADVEADTLSEGVGDGDTERDGEGDVLGDGSAHTSPRVSKDDDEFMSHTYVGVDAHAITTRP